MVVFHPVPQVQRSPADIGLFSGEDRPTCKYEEFGSITAATRGNTSEDEKVIDAIRERVAGASGDGVVGLHKGAVGSVGQGAWQGTMFRCLP